MAGKPINLSEKIAELLTHVGALPPESVLPFAHYQRSSTDLLTLLRYIEEALKQPTAKGARKPAVRDRHLSRLHGMLLVSLVESFERYLKEIAAACVDFLAPFVLDDRFNVFKIQGSAL